MSAIAVLLIATIGFLIHNFFKIPQEVEISDEIFIIRFPFGKQKEYLKEQILYFATGAMAYMRGGYCHSVIFEFNDNSRVAVSSIMINNYDQFLETVKRMDLKYYGFIGKNNWRKKHKPISKKWITHNEEEQLVSIIGKESGVVFSYILGFIFVLLNLFLVAGFIFGFENLRL